MLRAKYFFALVIFLYATSALAFNSTQKNNLAYKVGRVCATYESRVGMSFIDLNGGWEFQHNGSLEYPAASVIKVAVMAAAYHLADAGELDLGGKIVLKESDKVGGSGVLQWMRPGKAYTLRNLCRLMIVLSDNTATRMLVDHIGQKRINNYLAGVGLPHTVVMDPTMLREPPASGINQTTPAEMAYLIVQIKEGHGFSKKSSAEMLSYMKNQRYRWGIWRGVAPGTMVADKTGNLERIFNDAGLVYTRSGNYVLSVFTQGLKKRPARELINQISRIAYEEYTGEKVITVKKTIKRKLSRRPSAKYRPPSGRRGAVSGRK